MRLPARLGLIASALLLAVPLVTLVTAPAAGAAANTTMLTGGSALAAGQSLVSPNRGYRAVMQSDGNFVVYRANGSPVWSSGTWGRGGTSITMQRDGNLVLYGSRGAVWASNTTPNRGDELVMQNDSNLVIYNGYDQAVWSSLFGATGVRQDTLSAGHSLTAGRALFSASGGYEALMQTDGNFVVYRGGVTATWATGTSGGGALVTMQTDGNLVVYLGARAPWASATEAIGANRVVLRNDGTLAIDNSRNQVLWSTPGYGPGPNAYLCSATNYSCDNTGYAGQAVWDFAGPHNCTDYVAWRLAQRGVADPGNLGNGGDWSTRARAFGLTVNQLPTVGAVAAYDYGSEWAPAAGHVGYVIQVGPGFIIIAEDNFPGSQPGHLDVRRALPGTNWWPSSFIHF